MTVARRVYRKLLLLLPGSLRERYGRDMEDLFLESLTRARRQGLPALVLCWARAVRDVVGAAPRQHWRRRGRRKGRGMSALLADLRFALRAGLRQKGSTGLALFTLILAVAANTAVLSLLDALFLRPLPVAHPERMVYLDEQAPKWNLAYTGINYPDFAAWRRQTRVSTPRRGPWCAISIPDCRCSRRGPCVRPWMTLSPSGGF